MTTLIIQAMSWLMKNKAVKVGAAGASGGGIILLVLVLHADINKKIEAQKIDQEQYADLIVAPIKTEISNLKTQQTETNSMVRDIHIYLLNSKSK